jgi:proteasome component ECM29
MISSCLRGNVWNVQLAILQSLKTFVEHSTTDSLRNENVMKNILKACLDSLEDLKYSAIRSAAVDVLEQLTLSDTGNLILNDSILYYLLTTC